MHNSQCLRLAMDMLLACESHPGALCRTLLELADVVGHSGDFENKEKYLALAEGYRQQISDVDTSGFRGTPSEYDRFVTVGLR
jgi:hypothetical protein